MERHTVSILILVAVTATAFPILYDAQASEHRTPRVVYQMSALSEQTSKDADTYRSRGPITTPWKIKQQEIIQAVKPVTEQPEKSVKKPVPSKPTPAQVQVVASKKVTTTAQPEVTQEKKQEAQIKINLGFIETVRSEIQRLTDRERNRKNLNVFKKSVRLTNIALEHSTDMLDDNYFAHTAPDGCTLTCRFEDAAYKATTWGENIASLEGDNIPTAKEVAQSFFEQWMQSSGHRKNILSAEYTHQGIGVVKQGDAVYVTVNFSKPI